MVICDKIYNMENNPEQSQPTVYYLPEELNLDQTKKEDLELYVASKGFRAAGELLLERRRITTEYHLGEFGLEQYETRVAGIDQEIEKVFSENGVEAP